MQLTFSISVFLFNPGASEMQPAVLPVGLRLHAARAKPALLAAIQSPDHAACSTQGWSRAPTACVAHTRLAPCPESSTWSHSVAPILAVSHLCTTHLVLRAWWIWHSWTCQQPMYECSLLCAFGLCCEGKIISASLIQFRVFLMPEPIGELEIIIPVITL